MRSPRNPYTFAGIPWGSSSEAVKQTLAAKGYAFVKEDDDGDIDFTGTIARTPARIYAFIDDNHRLVKMAGVLITEDPDARRVYESMVDQLRAKYGEPDVSTTRFDSPYYEGDGYEDQAIRLAKGHLGTCWAHGKPLNATGNDALCASVTRKLTISIEYESVAWDKEFDRRNAKAAKDL